MDYNKANLIVTIIGIVVDAILAGVALGISIKAILQTKTQIELSNKHQLFDRRLESYVLASSLIENYKSARKDLNFDDLQSTLEKALNSIVFRAEILDASLVTIPKQENANVYLDSINNKLSIIRRTATEISIIFQSNEAKTLAEFVDNLSFFILSGITYNIYLSVPSDRAKELEKEAQHAKDTFKYHFTETDKLYKKAIETKALDKLLGQIKL